MKDLTQPAFNHHDYAHLEEPYIKRWEADKVKLEDTLTQDMVGDIRQWRVGDGPDDTNNNSWRTVATLFADKYPEYASEHHITSGNQICGIMLCDTAMKLLKQKPEEGWN